MCKEINILISSTGRRVELVQAFINARRELKINGKIIGTEIDETAPALQFVDSYYIVPKIIEENYINKIIEICRKEKISLIIPTLDTELLVYAKEKERIEREVGTKVMISDYSIIKLIRDKIKMADYFRKYGISVPKTLTKEELQLKEYKFPLFIKPFDGSSSINNFKVNNEKELEFFKDYVKQPLIQEFISGIEYCVDIFTDLEGKLISIVPKRRIAHRGGEITKGKIEKNKKIIEFGKKIVEILKPKGEINFDCMLDENDKITLIEVNGRFAGGAPMSFKAGANSPLNLYKNLLGEKLIYTENYKEILVLRFDQAIEFTINK